MAQAAKCLQRKGRADILHIYVRSTLPVVESIASRNKQTVWARYMLGLMLKRVNLFFFVQQVKRSILHKGMMHNKIHLICPRCPRPSISLQCRIVVYNTVSKCSNQNKILCMDCVFDQYIDCNVSSSKQSDL